MDNVRNTFWGVLNDEALWLILIWIEANVKVLKRTSETPEGTKGSRFPTPGTSPGVCELPDTVYKIAGVWGYKYFSMVHSYHEIL